ncbi:aldose epimerase family protein [Mangrovibacterium diazotrophicum]|uniref:Aldose 1-epimerase n=1 Tax=Mangrovibacterium diazotrophicum TaxID=1261403 RepID=A0A419VYJ6_9BACT|nr:aldose epimerase family protein [Mangrovibacterium diazotrophicum]RKD88301.1 aldose 1-epimerase [Mangrovibacterium diazotrophicum]
MKINELILLLGLVILFSAAMTVSTKNDKQSMLVKTKDFGTTGDGLKVQAFVLKNSQGVEIEIIEFGAIVRRIVAPDQNGKMHDIALGYDDLAAYEKDPYYFGATIGRVANRIGTAAVTINDSVYNLAKNTLPDFGPNHLHGGLKGFNKVVWSGKSFEEDDLVGVKLTYLSADGEEGYPGNLSCEVVYTLNEANELGIQYRATSDKVTIVNFTHHSYFNLAGAGNATVLDQLVQINAEKYTPADEELIPTGEIKQLDGSAVDFRKQRSIGSRLAEMASAKYTGYDLNYVLPSSGKGQLVLAATALDPVSGLGLEVWTTQPCVHFYTGNFLDDVAGKEDKIYTKYGAFCFEPQGYPDAPNKANFQSIELKPGQTYKQRIVYKLLTN